MEDEEKDSYTPLQNIEAQAETGTTENTTDEGQTAEITVEYTIDKDDITEVETVDGTTLSLFKFDETFIEPTVDTSEKVDYDVDMDSKEIKNAVIEALNGYKTTEEIITEEVETEVAQKVEELETLQEEIKTAEEELAKAAEEMKITSENIQTKIGEHLNWAMLVYNGTDYGLGFVYEKKDMTDTVSIPGIENMMIIEIVGLESIQSLKDQAKTYISSSAISKINQYWLESGYKQDLKEYNGKVYWLNGGIGGGYYFGEKKVLSSEDGISKVQFTVINSMGDIVEATITLTVKYDKSTGEYMITDADVK